MAYYLVTARPKPERLAELAGRLGRNEFEPLRPFGRTLNRSLRQARLAEDGVAVWEEEDYCVPPLAQERAAVLDDYFEELRVEAVRRGEGWRRIGHLPPLFPELAATQG